jgi:ABC-2 type transport system permease protein
LTPRWSRFWIIPRYAYEDLFSSKFMTLYFFACFIPALVFGILIYLLNNLSLLQSYGVTGRPPFEPNADFFFWFLQTTTGLGFLLVAFIGPSLISPDLTNNALPLYLCRPLSRAEYVIGKTVVLAWMLSQITWMPGLFLFLLQASLAESGWWRDNLRIAAGIFIGAWIWILFVSLVAITLSAWVKWRAAATGLLIGVFFFAAGFGAAINEVLETTSGSILNLPQDIQIVWQSLLHAMPPPGDVSASTAWMAILTVIAGCLALLSRKVKAREVVK